MVQPSPLNYDNCDLADCEKYFKRKVSVDIGRNVTAGQVYRHFKGHIVMMCESFGWDIDEIMQMNVDKLKARYPEGFDVERANHRAKGDV